jgi:hypothetical protein
MKNRLRSVTISPLYVAALITAALVEFLHLGSAPAPLPPVTHSARCRACSASAPAAAVARDADLLDRGAIEMPDS